MEVADGEYWAALVWCNLAPGDGITIESHVVAAPQYRGRWLTRPVIKQLDYIIDHTGCTRMIAQITSPLTARLWAKFGFAISGPIAHKDIIRHGQGEEGTEHGDRRPAGDAGRAEDEDAEGREGGGAADRPQ